MGVMVCKRPAIEHLPLLTCHLQLSRVSSSILSALSHQAAQVKSCLSVKKNFYYQVGQPEVVAYVSVFILDIKN